MLNFCRTLAARTASGLAVENGFQILPRHYIYLFREGRTLKLSKFGLQKKLLHRLLVWAVCHAVFYLASRRNRFNYPNVSADYAAFADYGFSA